MRKMKLLKSGTRRMFKTTENKKPHLCQAYRCGNPRQKKDRLCGKHRHRFNKENNPVRYTYNLLKSNARRRGKPFALSFEYFEQFCRETNYIELKGRGGGKMSIDCKVAALGYIEGNIRILEFSHNASKGNRDVVPF